MPENSEATKQVAEAERVLHTYAAVANESTFRIVLNELDQLRSENARLTAAANRQSPDVVSAVCVLAGMPGVRRASVRIARRDEGGPVWSVGIEVVSGQTEHGVTRQCLRPEFVGYELECAVDELARYYEKKTERAT
jgi:hypothetical protein